MLRTFLTLGRLLALVSALFIPACQLVVDFDRDLIVPDAGSDAGAADGATSDMSTDADAGADAASDDLGPEDAGFDAGSDLGTDQGGRRGWTTQARAMRAEATPLACAGWDARA
jgi:hypothetical protein